MIPSPASLTPGDGALRLDERTTIGGDGAAAPVARWLAERLREPTGLPLAESADPVIRLSADPSLGAERYRLSVTPDGARIIGGDADGVRRGAQTLRQLLPPAAFREAPVGERDWEVPAVEIDDRPRHAWRGVMLDVARHFLPPREVRRFLDLLAMHKINVLHLHLTDDQGWRIEIERFPLLTEVGGWRPRSQVGHRTAGVFDRRPHGGFYTRDDLREIVAHAERLGILVVPEIEMPGHVGAAIAAYPELGLAGAAPAEVPGGWGIGSHVLNLREETVDFFRQVLDEVVEIFPSPVIGIGADECPVEPWEADAETRERQSELGLASASGLQPWFVARIEEHLAARGRRAIGWEEILDGPPSRPDTAVLAWRGDHAVARAAEAGVDVVACPDMSAYLDYRQSDGPDEPIPIGTVVDVDTVVAFDPVPPGLADDARAHVLGGQANLWTENIDHPRAVDFAAFPRVAALAEALWSGPASPDAFAPRLAGHLERLTAAGVEFRPPAGPAPWQRRPDATGHPISRAEREAELRRVREAGRTTATMG